MSEQKWTPHWTRGPWDKIRTHVVPGAYEAQMNFVDYSRACDCVNGCNDVRYPAAVPQMVEALEHAVAFLESLHRERQNVRNWIGARALHDRVRAALAAAGITTTETEGV